jgi:hypothetical protein
VNNGLRRGLVVAFEIEVEFNGDRISIALCPRILAGTGQEGGATF